MPTPRTRKTAAAGPEEKTPEAPQTETPEITSEVATEDKAAPADTETKVPDVAPLEPPTEPEPEPEPAPITTPQQLLPAQLADRIVDEATGELPADPDAVFVPVQPHGSSYRCTVRLIEHVGMGAYNTPASRLLVPVGAELQRHQAQRIIDRLRDQLHTAPDSE
ncbi:hypothetical protein [Streptomyces tirandamycinicus]|uniref:Uncharacterized protein n=1 Tax=Streptomyces tirandamycinicus TaxID=2174846 RepID=A0A2S1T2F4_9ACTN|nr:hypothetical protein [Streptomyces tirandamycinicus]AWI32697.1 hypothetical protein DDW44_30745 [Streptomyces tirandamycinicus]